MEHKFEKPTERSRQRKCVNPECDIWETAYSKTTECPQPTTMRERDEGKKT